MVRQPNSPRALVGRRAELATLEQLWAAARAGHGTAALIDGEAGIGKSRLVAELVARFLATGGLPDLVLRGRCFEQDRTVPYGPLLDLLRSRFAERSSREIAAALGPAGPELIGLLPELAAEFPARAAAPAL